MGAISQIVARASGILSGPGLLAAVAAMFLSLWLRAQWVELKLDSAQLRNKELTQERNTDRARYDQVRRTLDAVGELQSDQQRRQQQLQETERAVQESTDIALDNPLPIGVVELLRQRQATRPHP